MGRPSKLTPELQEQIVEDIRAGNFAETAAEAAGIDQATYYRWLQWGKRGKEPYSAFCEAIARARAEAERDLLKTVADGDGAGISNGKAKSAQWILERTRPRKFAQRVNLKVEDELNRFLDVAQRVLATDDFVRLLEAFDAEAGEGPAAEAAGTESRTEH